MKYYKVALDCMGSDKGVGMMVKGASLALEKYEDLSLLLVGDSEAILSECEKNDIPMDRVEILHASQLITNYDSPATALFEKTDSSLVVALNAVGTREDLVGLVNAGSTGALLAGTVRYLSSADRTRPALAAALPAEKGGFVCLVDTGATIDATAQMLLHFARLGTDFMRNMYSIDSPRVGLLSNGAEETKGNKLVKEAHALLKNANGINFVGNIEGTNALSGDCDVLVSDGFAGNLVLKVTEGTARRIITDIVKIAKKSGKNEYMALAGELMAKYDFNSLGGGIILGAKKTVVKAHGAANEISIVSTLGIVLNIAKNKDVFNNLNKEG
jgi:glycerol-3-phosphate acyltransferase PlsX